MWSGQASETKEDLSEINTPNPSSKRITFHEDQLEELEKEGLGGEVSIINLSFLINLFSVNLPILVQIRSAHRA